MAVLVQQLVHSALARTDFRVELSQIQKVFEVLGLLKEA